MAHCKNGPRKGYNYKEAVQDLELAIRMANLKCAIVREQIIVNEDFFTQPRRSI